MVSVDQVRAFARELPRAEEHFVRDRIKFRIRSIVFLSFAPEGDLMGFGYPKEERAALIASDPEKFLPPVPADERYNWLRVRLDAIDEEEMAELVVDSWRMCVPKFVAAAYLNAPGRAPGR